MGRNAKIREHVKVLKRELSRINQNLSQEQKDKLFLVARKKMMAEFLDKKN